VKVYQGKPERELSVLSRNQEAPAPDGSRHAEALMIDGSSPEDVNSSALAFFMARASKAELDSSRRMFATNVHHLRQHTHCYHQ
jgi:hypothetical protein